MEQLFMSEIIGYGFSSNGGHISNPTIEIIQDIEKSLLDAQIKASQIDYINAYFHTGGYWRKLNQMIKYLDYINP
ncbi:MAG: hypothetical protein IPP53_10210 [Bacteroidetes bacterium]|nr:hypothetical protein [Bacteroidota bacterium]